MRTVWNMILVACVGLILACVIILCGCATGIVRVKGDGAWSFYGFQFCQEFSLPTLNVHSNGLFDVYSLYSKPDSNAVKGLAEGAARGMK